MGYNILANIPGSEETSFLMVVLRSMEKAMANDEEVEMTEVPWHKIEEEIQSLREMGRLK